MEVLQLKNPDQAPQSDLAVMRLQPNTNHTLVNLPNHKHGNSLSTMVYYEVGVASQSSKEYVLTEVLAEYLNGFFMAVLKYNLQYFEVK